MIIGTEYYGLKEGNAVVQIASAEIAINDLFQIKLPEYILSGVMLITDLYKYLEATLDAKTTILHVIGI